MKTRLSVQHTTKTCDLFSNIMLSNDLESEVSRFITHVQFIWATILISFNFLSVMSLVSSYQRKTRIFIFTFLLLCPCNQSIAQTKRKTDGVELPLRHMKFTASTRAFADEPQLAANKTFLALCHRNFALDWLVSVAYCIFWHFTGSDKLSYFSYIGQFAYF